MTLSWVGSRELAFLKTPENLICLAHQVFSPMAFLGVGACVLAPGIKGEKGLGPASPNSESSMVLEKGEGRVLGPSIGHRS